MQRDEYLPSIDGLRAVAVLAVIAYHLHAAFLPGGFVGVDVFFVISGFIVARSVADAGRQAPGFLNFLGWFYKRRFMRIVPALTTFVIVTAVLTALIIPTVEPTRFIIPTGIAALFGASNVFIFAKLSNYFATASEFNPFTHTWSLGVEEQYYFVFPFFSYLLLIKANTKPVLRRAALALLCAACVASLLICALVGDSNQSFAFFMLPTRFWELGLGFLTFYLLKGWSPGPSATRVGDAAFVLGALALGAALWTTEQSSFPFPGAILPCLATALLIVSTWKLNSSVGSTLLSLRPVNYVGKISYSLYLWHWGVIVFARWIIGDMDAVDYLVSAAIIFALAAGSYHLIETPIRRNTLLLRLPPLKTAASATLTLGLSAALCGVLWLSRPTISLSVTRDQAAWDPKSIPAGGRCAVKRTVSGRLGGTVIDYVPTDCGAESKAVWAIGDSHAGAYERAYYRMASEGWTVHLMTLGGCRLVHSSEDQDANCEAFQRYAISRAISAAAPRDVVFAPGLLMTRTRDSWGTSIPLKAQRFDAAKLYSTNLKPLVDHGLLIVLEGPKPLLPSAAFRCSDWFTRENTYCRDGLSVSREAIETRSASSVAALHDIAARSSQIRIWSPASELCDRARCDATMNGKPLYYDTDHLSAYGNDRLYQSLRAAIAAAMKTTIATDQPTSRGS